MNLKINNIITLIVLLCYNFHLTISDCKLSLKDHFAAPQPLVLNERGLNLIYPDTNSLFKIHKNHEIIIACPGSTVTINQQTYVQTTLRLKCIEDQYFQVNPHQILQATTINCIKSSLIHLEHVNMQNDYIKIAVRLRDVHLSPLIVHYFDYRIKITAYTMYPMVSSVKGQTNCWQSSYFSESSFYEDLEDKMNDIYTKKTQRNTINSLLNLPSSSTKYIKDSGELYLARGHLAASCDFVYEAQQKATYYYVNVVPQWQTFNNGNWRKLENDLRSYASRNGIDLFIIAGTYGIASLLHEKGQHPVDLYLSVNSNGRKAVPVPKFIWKLAFDLRSKKGAVFIGMNNPYQKNEFICRDISGMMKWLTWDKNNKIKGYSHACSINDFQRIVKLPIALQATGGLLS